MLALGLRREERVLLCLQDTVDFPVAFLGALYAGVVPVAVNTLLTADDYAYMLAHSRAQALFVSGALLPTLEQALARGGHDVAHVVVSRATAPLPQGALEFTAWTRDGHLSHPSFKGLREDKDPRQVRAERPRPRG